MRFLWLVAFGLLLRTRAVSAQVNVEPLRQQVTARRFGAHIAASTDAYAGNPQGDPWELGVVRRSNGTQLWLLGPFGGLFQIGRASQRCQVVRTSAPQLRNQPLNITTHLQSKLDATARYESVTPSDVRRADLELESSLQVVF